ncbi:MAG: XdhC family protein [Candidatus Eremiobacteraeota bacterium]|nr:XdhC family protein [Candidatus Eremiobacteraeota bacterium]
MSVRDVFETAAVWLEAKRPFALATLVDLRGAKSAAIGTTMAVAVDCELAGNIGAGCFESEIVEAARQTARDGKMRRVDLIAATDELLGDASCGVEMHVVVWRPEHAFAVDARAIAAGDRAVYLPVSDFRYVVPPREPLILVGATTLAADLAAIARRADFRVVVVDPRPLFATPARLPDADEILKAWPDVALPGLLSARSALVVLSHDPKLDLPALRCALHSDAWYVGLLGSRRAQESRCATLEDEGFAPEALERIRGPVGLDLGATSTGEIAVAILAEMLAVRHARTGAPLRVLRGRIH